MPTLQIRLAHARPSPSRSTRVKGPSKAGICKCWTLEVGDSQQQYLSHPISAGRCRRNPKGKAQDADGEIRNVLSDDLGHTCAQAWRLRHGDARLPGTSVRRRQGFLPPAEPRMAGLNVDRLSKPLRVAADHLPAEPAGPCARAASSCFLCGHPRKASRESQQTNGTMPPPLTRVSRHFCGHACFVASKKHVRDCYGCVQWTHTGLPKRHRADSRSLACTPSAQ